MSTANALQSEQASLRFLYRILLDFATVILCQVRNVPVNDSTARAYLERVRFVNIAMNLNTILELTEYTYPDNSYGTTFNQVCSEFLLLCETLISDDVLKNKQYHAHDAAKTNLDNKVCAHNPLRKLTHLSSISQDNLTKLLFLDSRRPTQTITDFEAEEDITVGEHWLAYLDVGKMLYEDNEFQRQVRRIEATATEQITLSMSKTHPKSASVACQEAIKCSLSDTQETVEVNPNGAPSPVIDKVKECGVSGHGVPSLKTRPSTQQTFLTKSPLIESELGHRSIWRSAWNNIKEYDFLCDNSQHELMRQPEPPPPSREFRVALLDANKSSS